MTRRQVALGLHVVVDLVQVEVQLFPVQNVLFAKARNQPGFLNVLHLFAQLTILENLATFEANLGDAHARAFVDLKSDCIRGCRHFFDGGLDRRIRVSFGGEHLFEHASRIPEFDRVFDCLFRNAHALLTKSLQYIRLGYTLESFKLNVANDREFTNVESYVNSAAWTIFNGDSSFGFVEEAEGIESLQVALNLGGIVGVSRAGLNVIDYIVFAQASIADNVHVFDHARRLLRARPIYEEQGSGSDKEAQNGEPDDAI